MKVIHDRPVTRLRQLQVVAQERDRLTIKTDEFLGMAASFGVREMVEERGFCTDTGAYKAASRVRNRFTQGLDDP